MTQNGPVPQKRRPLAWIGEHVPGWIQAVVAVITLVASFCGGFQANAKLVPRPAPTVTVTVGTPSGGGPSGSGPSEASSSGPDVKNFDRSSCAAGQQAFDVLVPAAQAGWDPRWHGCRTVDSAGIRFSDDVPSDADGEDYQLTYRSQDGGWDYDGDGFVRWRRSGTPGPSYCAAELDSSANGDAARTTTAAGRAYCLDQVLGTGATRMIFFQVYAVSGDKVQLDMWIWRRTGG